MNCVKKISKKLNVKEKFRNKFRKIIKNFPIKNVVKK